MKNEWVQLTKSGAHISIRPTLKYKTTTVYAVVDLPMNKDFVTRRALMPSLLMHGTKSHPTPDSFMRAVEDLYGASMHARAGKHGDVQTIEFILQVPNEKIIGEKGLFAKAFQLFSEMIFDPFEQDHGFSAKAFEVEKELHRQKILNLVNDKISYAAERCLEIMAEGEPYGIPRLGYVKDLDEISPVDLLKDYQELVQSNPIHIYIVGDVLLEETEDVVEQMFGVYQKSDRQRMDSMPALRQNQNHFKPRDTVIKIEEMEVNQGKLNMGFRTNVSYASDDYPALLMYNGILGGFTHSKLFLNVREKASLAYYASSRLEGLKGYLFIYAGIESSKYDQAIEMIDEQCQDLRNAKITEDELEFTRSGLVNQYLQSDDPPLTGAAMQMYARYSGRAWSVKELISAIESVKIDDVVRVAQNVHLDTLYFLREKEGMSK